MLFTAFDRTDDSPKRWSESSYRWLDRSSRRNVARIRAALETWAAEYPTEGLNDLTARFRSLDDLTHEGAFFELLLHALLRALGCQLQVHPTISGTDFVPDFLVHSPKGHCFYLEATICADQSATETAAQKRLDDLRDALDRIGDDRFIFDLRYEGTPAAPISGRRMRDTVERALGKLDHAEVRARFEAEGWNALPSWTFKFEGFTVRLSAIPRMPDKLGEALGRAVGISMGGARWLATSVNIRNALERKAGRYGELSLPYVIAVNVLGEFPPDMIDVWNALLGREAVSIELFQDGTQRETQIRQPDGLWISKGGP